MKAMVLAAGLGTRLRPLTNDRPKALAEIAGHTLLEITLARLRAFGIEEVIVNVHHFAEMVADYLQRHGNFGMRIELSREEVLLDTGGGLLRAADFFLRDALPAGDAEPFLLHNVDILSSIDLGQMVRFHRRQGALATLAVQRRTSSRSLLLDAGMRLCGRQVAGEQPEMAREGVKTEAWAFAGIHVLSPRIFELMELMRSGPNLSAAEGTPPVFSPVFSIVPEYLRLAAAGEKILGCGADGFYWRDLGTLESLQQASEDAARGRIAL